VQYCTLRWSEKELDPLRVHKEMIIIRQLVRRNRSYRRFHQGVYHVPERSLEGIIVGEV
jgi:hypothetical protein